MLITRYMNSIYISSIGQRTSATHRICPRTCGHFSEQCWSNVLYHDEEPEWRPVGETNRLELQGRVLKQTAIFIYTVLNWTNFNGFMTLFPFF